MVETKHTFCRICEACCGLEVDVEGGRVTDIRPDREHVVTRGCACIKGIRYRELHESPDRLRHPMERVGDRWERRSWDEALRRIGAKVQELLGSTARTPLAPTSATRSRSARPTPSS